ncbi:reverse transcriptase domain-containing protein [Tanacetum coccineum]
MKIPNVPNTSVKLMLFPFSLEGAARIWLEKEPPRSIETWDDLVTKFINKFFPPSKTTNLRNEITRFQQKFDETFCEAWDRFNDLLRGCPHHGFSELHQLDTFYNALNSIDQDSLNSAAGGNFLDKMRRECLKIIESKSKVRQSRNKAVVAKMSTSSSTPAISSDVAELKDMVRALILDRKNQTPASAPVKAVEQSCVTCGGVAHQGPAPQTHGVSKTDFERYVTANDAVLRNMQNQGQNLQSQMANLTDMLSKFVTANTASTSGSGTLPGNTVTNPKEDLKAFISVIQMPNVSPVDTPIPKASIPFPSRRNDERRKEKANEQIEKFYEIFKDMNFEISFLDALTLMPKFASTLKALIGNKEKLSEMAKLNETCSAVILNKLPKKLGDPGRFLIPCEFSGIKHMQCLGRSRCKHQSYAVFRVEGSLSSELTPTKHDAKLSGPLQNPTTNRQTNSINSKSREMMITTHRKLIPTYMIPDGGHITYLEKHSLNNEPPTPIPNQGDCSAETQEELKLCEAKTVKSSIDEPPEVELKDLPPHLESISWKMTTSYQSSLLKN